MKSGACLALGTAFILALAGMGQSASAQELSDDAREQLLSELDAMIIGTSVTTRCALYDTTLTYLSPLETTGAELRIAQLRSALSEFVEELPDLMATMRSEANDIDCGNQGLEPFIAFSRETAQDVIDIALSVWREVSIDHCSYFADDGFMDSVKHTKILAAETTVEGPDVRRDYIAENATAWGRIFNENCFNVNFDPVPTLPGRIALSVPIEE